MVAALFVTLAVCLVMEVPIAISLGISALAASACIGIFPQASSMLGQAVVTTSDSFSLMAMPFFMLVGSLMEESGIADRIVKVAEAIVGPTAGGLANAAIVAAIFFAGISGSGPAEVAALGSILIPAMSKRGYKKEYAASVVASASTIGPVIPPSIPMIVYGVTTGVSVSAMFMAGIIPGALMGLVLIAVNAVISRKRNYHGLPRGGGFIWVMKEIWKGLLALIMPFIVLGGIYSGVVTPTESAIIAVFYSLIVGKFVYKTLTLKKIYKALLDAAKLSAPVMFLLGGATLFGRVLTIAHIPTMLANWMLSISSNKTVIMLMIMIFFLISGMFIDTTSNIVLFAPLFCPIVSELGYSLVFFGVLMVINLCIGFLTPPLGMNLFVAQGLCKRPLMSIVKENMPFLIALIILLFVFMLFPDIITFLPDALGV